VLSKNNRVASQEIDGLHHLSPLRWFLY